MVFGPNDENESRHGLAKSLFGGLAELGVEIDPGNPASLANAIEQFNSLSFEALGEILGLTNKHPEAVSVPNRLTHGRTCSTASSYRPLPPCQSPGPMNWQNKQRSFRTSG